MPKKIPVLSMPFQPGQPPFEAIPSSRRCSAIAKQTGQQCRQIASPGRAVCKWHGGWSLRGEAHPAYVHGDATQAARAYRVWINSLGTAIFRLERAQTPAAMARAVEFARSAIANEPN